MIEDSSTLQSGSAAGSGAAAIRKASMSGAKFSSDVGCQQFREFGFAGPFVRHCQQFYHLPTSDPFGQRGDEPVEGLTIRLPWEELVTTDQLQERHGFAPRKLDDVPIIDHIWPWEPLMNDRPRGNVMKVSAADEQIEAIIVKPNAQPMPDQP